MAGLTGGFNNNLNKRVESNIGNLALENQSFLSFHPQTRVIKSQEQLKDDTVCNQCGVESDDEPYYRDRGFCYLIIWSGRMGITGVRMFAMVGAWDNYNGKCTGDEVAPRVLNVFGCGSASQPFSNATPFPIFTATSKATVGCPGSTCGGQSIGVAEAQSVVSQEDANKKSAGAAVLNATALLQCW